MLTLVLFLLIMGCGDGLGRYKGGLGFWIGLEGFSGVLFVGLINYKRSVWFV